MEIKKIEHAFSVCKVPDFSQVDLEKEYCFTGTTDEEKSLVCLTESVPENATLMADNHIGIFAVSTYNTDYILTKQEHFEKALRVLAEAGYLIV